MITNNVRSLKFFLDPCCPRSLLFFKLMEKHLTPQTIVPVSNFKISFMRRIKEARKNPDNRDDKTDFQEMFLAHAAEVCDSTQVEKYKQHLEHRCLFPQNYIIAIKEHFPHLLLNNFNVFGKRLYQEGLPIHKGCYLSTCARLAGLELRESEFIISRLTHRRYRKEVDDIAMNCAMLDTPLAPFISVKLNDESGNSRIITDVDEKEISSYFNH